jgi:hypothetical protein
MPDSPRNEVARRRALRESTLRGQSQYHGRPRVLDIDGNTPLPADNRQTISEFYLEDTNKPEPQEKKR